MQGGDPMKPLQDDLVFLPDDPTGIPRGLPDETPTPSQVRASFLKLLGEGWRPCIHEEGTWKTLYTWDARAIYRRRTGKEPPAAPAE